MNRTVMLHEKEYNFENDSRELIELIPREQWKLVMSGIASAEIDPSFLGFVTQYKFLSILIPKTWTVIDLGCGYNAQSFYFQEHKRYIAVNLKWDSLKEYESVPHMQKHLFMAPNCEFFEMKISEFIKKHLNEFDLDKTFAICNYVPPWHGDNQKMVRESFKNVFCFYPS